MKYLTLQDILYINKKIIETSGGNYGVRDLNGLLSSVANPKQTFGGKDLYPTIKSKAAILGYSIIQNHPFIDGNKRTGHASMETFLIINGYEIIANVDEQEKIILNLASSKIKYEEFVDWLNDKVVLL